MNLPADHSHSKTCHRCASVIRCQPENIAHCDCRLVPLDAGERRFIRAAFGDCLCNACLLELKSQYASAERKKAIFCWSGGKDSALALHQVILDNQFEVCYLLTTLHQTFRRVSMHGVREALLDQQARSLGFPLLKVEVGEGTNAEYERQMEAVLLKARSEGIGHVIFGDIFLEDLRTYREHNLARVGMQAVFPLWKQATGELIGRFADLKFRTVLCCVNDAYLDQHWLGREIDAAFGASLPEGVDPCGENGEYHSFCFDGPVFGEPIAFQLGESVYKPLDISLTEEPGRPVTKGFWYIDLLPVEIPTV